MLQRCVEAGATYDQAFTELNWQTTLRGMRKSAERGKAKEAASRRSQPEDVPHTPRW